MVANVTIICLNKVLILKNIGTNYADKNIQDFLVNFIGDIFSNKSTNIWFL